MSVRLTVAPGSDATRWLLWWRLLRCGELRRRHASRASPGARDGLALYLRAASRGGRAGLGQTGLAGVIDRDVARTFPQDPLFQRADSEKVVADDESVDSSSAGVPDGQDALANVLLAVSRQAEAIGYCQGMNFVAATMLRTCLAYLDADQGGAAYAASLALLGAPRAPDGMDAGSLRVLLAEAQVFWALLSLVGPSGEASPGGPGGPGSPGGPGGPGSPGSPGGPVPSPVPHGAPPTPHRSQSESSAGSTADTVDSDRSRADPRGSPDPTVAERLLHPDGHSRLTTLAMGGLWRPGVPEMKRRIFEFDALLRLRLPLLHAHFKAVQLAPDVLVSQWFLTLFAYALPDALLLPAWDACFSGGWPAALSVALALLALHDRELRAQETLEDLGMYLRRCQWGRLHSADAPARGVPLGPPALRGGTTGSSSTAAGDWRGLVRLACRMDVTAEEMATLASAWALSLMRERLEGRGDGLLARYGDEQEMDDAALDEAREQLRGISGEKVTELAQGLMAKVERRRADLAQRRSSQLRAAAALQEERMLRAELQESKKALLDQVASLLSLRDQNLRLPSGAAPAAAPAPAAGPAAGRAAEPAAGLGPGLGRGADGPAAAAAVVQGLAGVEAALTDVSLGDDTSPRAESAPTPRNGGTRRGSILFGSLDDLDLAGVVDRIVGRSPRSPTAAAGSAAPEESVDPQLMEDLAVFAAKVESIEKQLRAHEGGPLRQAEMAAQEADLHAQEAKDGLDAVMRSLAFFLQSAEEEAMRYMLAISPEARALVAP